MILVAAKAASIFSGIGDSGKDKPPGIIFEIGAEEAITDLPSSYIESIGDFPTVPVISTSCEGICKEEVNFIASYPCEAG